MPTAAPAEPLFELQTLDRWTRIGPGDDRSRVETEPRPHLVPLTPEAERFVALDASGFMGRTGLCPGVALVGDRCVRCYRFIEVTPEAAAELAANLSDAVRGLSAAAAAG